MARGEGRERLHLLHCLTPLAAAPDPPYNDEATSDRQACTGLQFRGFILPPVTASMDKKAKKKLDVVHQKLGMLRQQLAGAKKQDDEPGEVQRLEREIADLEAQAEKLKTS